MSLLVGRPDLAVPLPADLGQLAGRATTTASTSRALDRLDRWHLQVLETVVVVAGVADAAPDDRVADLLPDAAPESVSAALSRLRDLALLWGADHDLRPTSSVRDAFGSDPGGLGPSAAALDRSLPDDLTGVLARAPAGARAALDALTWGPPRGSVARADRAVDKQRADTPISWLLAHDLLVAVDDTTVVVPAELALLLRGDRLFLAEPTPEPLDGVVVDPGRVDAAAAGTAYEFVRRVEDLLELWSFESPGVLRSGGLGVREVKSASRALDVPEDTVAFLAEIALQSGLLARDGEADESWAPTTSYDTWRLEPIEFRWVDLVQAWLASTRVIGLLSQRDTREQRRTPLGPDLDRVMAPEIRNAVLSDLRDAGHGVAVPADVLVAREAWRRPRRAAALRDALVRWTLDEAALVGVTALDAVSSFAADLITDPRDSSGTSVTSDLAGARLAALLPQPVDHVLLQADLTAVAPGPLDGTVARELGLMADVESTGGATVYRFTADSIRRALDAGRTTSELHAFVATHSKTPVPQPLSYLVDDVARRHGRLRVGSAAAYLRSDDPAVLDELIADRRSELLRLRRIAPTVVIAQGAPDVVLDRVRAMNLSPVAEAIDGGLLLRRPDARRAGTQQRLPRLVSDPPVPRQDVLAAAIRALRSGDRGAGRGTSVAGPAGTDAPPRTAVADTVAALRSAVDDHRSVWLGYVDDDGGLVERVVDPLEVHGGWLTAFDHRYEEVRTFRVHRISGVAALVGSAGSPSPDEQPSPG